MDTGAIVAMAVVVLVIGGSGGIWHLRSRRASIRRGPPARPASETMTGEEQQAALDRVKTAVHDLLYGVSGSLDSMQGDSNRYGRALAEHRESIEEMATVEDLREVEMRLFEQVKQVQNANDVYRRELDAANSKVAEQQKELEALHKAAGLDFLTELPNRRQLDQRMREELGRAKRHGQRFSIVILDVDHFKSVNDEYGHAAGDRVLRAIAQLLFDQKRSSDFLGRYGGEEFVLLLPETPLDNAARLADKIRTKVRETEFQFQKHRIKVTISAGVGEVAPETDTVDSLFDRVDAALYRAKQEGRDRVCATAAPAAPI
jgi:diguanylate cyclase (GGDEF)-like protein